MPFNFGVLIKALGSVTSSDCTKLLHKTIENEFERKRGVNDAMTLKIG